MTERSAAVSAAEAVWLELDPDPVLAVLHRPDPARRQETAVLLCPPFGWEEMSSYRGRRTWALELARAGHSCARITLPGTGDSGGSPRDEGRLPAWTGAVSGAAQWLRESTGAGRVAALGIGLGGMLACLAAEAGAPIDDLILWSVPAQGRTLLRELRAYARLVAAPYPQDREPGPAAEGDLALIGFLMSGETARAIEAVALRAPEARPGHQRRALLLGRDGLPVDKRLREQFELSGAEVTIEDGPGYTALMGHPQEAIAPDETIHVTLSWLARAPGGGSALPSVPHRVPHTSSVLHRGVPAVRETSLQFSGQLEGTFAILTDCPERDPVPLCVIWCNGGALHHIGPNRTWVEAARRWAVRGVRTVRIDLHGLGESGGDELTPLADRSLYVSKRTEETLAIIDQLAERGLGERFVLGGLCSGAYWALHAALADPRVAGTMLINLFAFFWSEELVAERQTERSLDALQGRAWRRLIRGQVSSEQIRRAMASLSPARLRGSARLPVQRAQSAQIERALDQLRDQGTEALLLLSRGEGLYDQLARQGVLDQLAQWPNLTIERIPTQDHMFRAPRLQRHVHESLDRALERVLDTASEAPKAVHR
jgi:alpha-beta hydrolase superfamily lysophospholipase